MISSIINNISTILVALLILVVVLAILVYLFKNRIKKDRCFGCGLNICSEKCKKNK